MVWLPGDMTRDHGNKGSEVSSELEESTGTLLKSLLAEVQIVHGGPVLGGIHTVIKEVKLKLNQSCAKGICDAKCYYPVVRLDKET